MVCNAVFNRSFQVKFKVFLFLFGIFVFEDRDDMKKVQDKLNTESKPKAPSFHAERKRITVGVFQIVPGSEFRAALWVCLIRSCCRCCSVGCHGCFFLSAVLSQSAVSCQPCNLELNTLFLSFEVSSNIIFRIALYFFLYFL